MQPTATAHRIITEAARQGFTPITGTYRIPAGSPLAIIELADSSNRGCVETIPVGDVPALALSYPFLTERADSY